MTSSADRTKEFIDLFLRAEPKVYAYIRSQIPRRADAEDVLQETATTLWTKFDDFISGSNFLAWAYQVARFKVRYYYSRQAREHRLFSQAFVDRIAIKAEQMASNLGELEPILIECMERLTTADRDVVQRCYGSTATVASVAEDLERPVNTIKSVLKRSRRILFECISRAINRERDGK